VESLIDLGARVRVVDDLSSGSVNNLACSFDQFEFVRGDLCAAGVAEAAVDGMDIVFHLAAIHGGRGFIDTFQAECSRNFILDGLVIDAAARAGVQNFVFASSGCVYPVGLQASTEREVRLAESDVGPPYHSDGLYGWAKLMAEQKLAALHKERGFPSVSCRFFTVYGERCPESHALSALVGRAFLRQDPFEIWGDGSQIRNWTYVLDITRGMILAGERLSDGQAINLGTEERISVLDAVALIMEMTGHRAEIKPLLDRPTGPVNRVASGERAREILGWEPQMDFRSGLQRLIDWYFTEASSAGLDEEGFALKLLTRTHANR
jgi:nucleoside-diphosphate-sugar epimerase